MNDRFKFRVFDKEDGKMHDVIFINYENNSIEWLNERDKKRSAFIGEVPVMQCTGRFDAADTLIYENDIVSLTGKNGFKPIYVVKYDNRLYKWVLLDNYSYLKGKSYRDFYKEYVESKKLYKEGYRVIGNIYMNPELLEEECN